MDALGELGFLFFLLLANGIFALAEIALVSSRRAKLEMRAATGDAGARKALALQESPGQFLSTVQVGITLVGIVAGAASGARLAKWIEPFMSTVPWLGKWSAGVSFALVVTLITFLSTLIGELVPKRLAIQAPERWASLLSRPMSGLSWLCSPLVRFLDWASGWLVRLLGVKPGGEQAVSEEEVRALIVQGHHAGALKGHEREMLEGVLELDDLSAADIMTPKTQIVWLDLDDPEDVNWTKIAESGHSHFPVHRGVRDNVLGVVAVKSLWKEVAAGGQPRIASLVQPPVFVPESMPAARIIEEFRKTRRHLALVVDEFGGIHGLVTLNDMMEAIVGALPEQDQKDDPTARRGENGEWMVDGMMEIEEAAAAVGFPLPETFDEDSYRTVAGFVLHVLGRVPAEGESFPWQGFRFEVIDMDKQRVDKVRVTMPPPRPPESDPPADDA